MSNPPLISVIIPTYNNANFILNAINSVLNQTFKNIEIIIIDDGSTDNTKTLLENLIQLGKIKYYFQENKGLAAARNTGLRHSTGKFLKFLDADDILYPQQLDLQANHLINKEETVLSVTDYELEFESKNKKNIKIIFGKSPFLARFIEGNPCPVHVILVSRLFVLEAGGFFEGLRSHEDSDLWIRLILMGATFEHIDYIGCSYKIHNASLSANHQKMFINNCCYAERLNTLMMPLIDSTHDAVRHQLLAANMKLIMTCFALREHAGNHLSVTLRVTQRLYEIQGNIIVKTLCSLFTVTGILKLIYLKNRLLNKNFVKDLTAIRWRNEDFYN